jgi:hypothetical protein
MRFVERFRISISLRNTQVNQKHSMDLSKSTIDEDTLRKNASLVLPQSPLDAAILVVVLGVSQTAHV